jgi:hypothetical protein
MQDFSCTVNVEKTCLSTFPSSLANCHSTSGPHTGVSSETELLVQSQVAVARDSDSSAVAR